MSEQVGISRIAALPEVPEPLLNGKLTPEVIKTKQNDIIGYLKKLDKSLNGNHDEVTRRINEFMVDATWTATTLAQIGANQNDYDLGTGIAYRLSSDASRDVTGFIAPQDGRVVMLINSGAQNIVLKHQSASSVAANRLINASAVDATLSPGASVLYWYDLTSSRWREIAGIYTAHEATHASGGTDAFTATDVLEAACKRIKETTDILTIGGIADGQYLKRSGASVVSSAVSIPAFTASSYYISAADATVANTTTPTNLLSQTVTAGTLGTENALMWFLAGTLGQRNSSTNDDGFVLRIKYAGTTMVTVTVADNDSDSVSSNQFWYAYIWLMGDGATNAQLAAFINGLPSTLNKYGTAAADDSVDQTFLVEIQWGSAVSSNTITLKYALAVKYNP